MGEKIQEFRKDFKRRMNGMGSGDLFSIISKIKPEKRVTAGRSSMVRPPSMISLGAKDIPSISVIHESWIPSTQPTGPLRVTNATPPMDTIQVTPSPALVASPYMHSPLVSPLMSPLRSPQRSSLVAMASPMASPLAPTIEIVSPTTGEDEDSDSFAGSSIVNEDTPPPDSFGSASTVEDSPLTSKEIALIERPLSTRYTSLMLENREKPIMTCDTVPETVSARFSKKDLMRPLPPSPPISASSSQNHLIQSLRHELVLKAQELKQEKDRLQNTVADIRQQYNELSSSQCSSRYSDITTLSGAAPSLATPCPPLQGATTLASSSNLAPTSTPCSAAASSATAGLNSRLQWIEFESNRLKIENEILYKKVNRGEKLQQEMHELKEENLQLSTELDHLQEINRRVIRLENDSVISNLEGEFSENCDAGNGPSNKNDQSRALGLGIGISNTAQSPLPSDHRSYRALQEQMADLQSQLLRSTAEQRAEWDHEREMMAERIRCLEESELHTSQELEKEKHMRIFSEQECLRAESSYSALYESLKQQKSRFQYQLKTIESKLMAIELTSDLHGSFKEDLCDTMVAQRDLFKGHRQLFQLQEHYMHVLERINAGMKEQPTKAQNAQVQDALCTLRQFLPPVRSDDSPQITGGAEY